MLTQHSSRRKSPTSHRHSAPIRDLLFFSLPLIKQGKSAFFNKKLSGKSGSLTEQRSRVDLDASLQSFPSIYGDSSLGYRTAVMYF